MRSGAKKLLKILYPILLPVPVFLSPSHPLPIFPPTIDFKKKLSCTEILPRKEKPALSVEPNAASRGLFCVRFLPNLIATGNSGTLKSFSSFQEAKTPFLRSRNSLGLKCEKAWAIVYVRACVSEHHRWRSISICGHFFKCAEQEKWKRPSRKFLLAKTEIGWVGGIICFFSMIKRLKKIFQKIRNKLFRALAFCRRFSTIAVSMWSARKRKIALCSEGNFHLHRFFYWIFF